jgi:hypothetical protein
MLNSSHHDERHGKNSGTKDDIVQRKNDHVRLEWIISRI